MAKRGNCLTCVYLDSSLDEIEMTTGDDIVGVCKRFPPAVCWDNEEQVAYATNPAVGMFEWCGEYRPFEGQEA